MWIRTSNGNLINLDNVVEVQKHHNHRTDDWKVIALTTAPDDSFTIASGLTEEKADSVLSVIWRAIPAEDSLDVSMLVKS